MAISFLGDQKNEDLKGLASFGYHNNKRCYTLESDLTFSDHGNIHSLGTTPLKSCSIEINSAHKQLNQLGLHG